MSSSDSDDWILRKSPRGQKSALSLDVAAAPPVESKALSARVNSTRERLVSESLDPPPLTARSRQQLPDVSPRCVRTTLLMVSCRFKLLDSMYKLPVVILSPSQGRTPDIASLLGFACFCIIIALQLLH